MDEKIERLLSWIDKSQKIVFLGGAGVSTDSGIADFRSSTGLYSGDFRDAYGQARAEEILSGGYLKRFPERFYRFYFENLIFPGAKPNIVHCTLARLEQIGKLSAVVTQNIDGLHESAGSRRVLCLHGSSASNTCMKCGQKYSLADIQNMGVPPKCICDGIVRPDVVLFGESLDAEVMSESAECISNADMLIVGGTSLAVFPAAMFVQYYRGEKFVIINRDATPYDMAARLVIREPLGEVFGAVERYIDEFYGR